MAFTRTGETKLGHCEIQIRPLRVETGLRTKRVHGNARQRYSVNRARKNATNVFENSNNLNALDFKHLVDIEGVTGSIPVAPTTQSIGIELRPIPVHLARGTWAFRVYVRLCIGLRKTKIGFCPSVSASKNSVPGSVLRDRFDDCVGGWQFGPFRLHHPHSGVVWSLRHSQ
jgi:hypothetical protein